MGAASKGVSVFLRLVELVSAAVVAGIVGQYLHYRPQYVGSRITYTEAIAGISIFFSIVMLVPFKYFFYAFALDFALFIMWMVSFALLVNLTHGHTCNSDWYYNNWGYYYGGYYKYASLNNVNGHYVSSSACARWQSVLAFVFISSIAWLLSSCLGIYVVATRDTERRVTEQETSQVPNRHDKHDPLRSESA